MINILAHRGMWKNTDEKNSACSIERALKNGFGFESDVRDYMGELVISHNIANANCMKVDYVLKLLKKYEDKFCFAINIKADGLNVLLKQKLLEYHLRNYFTFDMSIPQMIEYNDVGLTFFTRQSELESNPCMYDKASGVWVDGFWSMDWVTEKLINEHVNNGKKVCIVSPELHQRDDYFGCWKFLKKSNIDLKNIYLCSDYPKKAKEFFYNED